MRLSRIFISLVCLLLKFQSIESLKMTKTVFIEVVRFCHYYHTSDVNILVLHYFSKYANKTFIYYFFLDKNQKFN